MPIFHLVILALIQGVTEFLPVSSSGHLALYPLLGGAADQGLAIDVAVHVGTLVAVIAYFRDDVAFAIRGGFRLLGGDFKSAEAQLALLLVVATIPVVIAGLVLSAMGWTGALRSLPVIGWATIIGGALLWVFDRGADGDGRAEDWRMKHAVAMGAAQALALIPGMSRSGVTITAARALGYARVDAARLSMLMSIPTIIAAGALIGLDLARAGDAALGLDAAIAAALSCVAALAAITLFMRMMKRWTMTPFVLYRLALGAAVLAYAYA